MTKNRDHSYTVSTKRKPGAEVPQSNKFNNIHALLQLLHDPLSISERLDDSRLTRKVFPIRSTKRNGATTAQFHDIGRRYTSGYRTSTSMQIQRVKPIWTARYLQYTISSNNNEHESESFAPPYISLASPGCQLPFECAMRVSDGNRVPRLKNHMVDTTNVEEHQTPSTVNKEEGTSEF